MASVCAVSGLGRTIIAPAVLAPSTEPNETADFPPLDHVQGQVLGGRHGAVGDPEDGAARGACVLTPPVAHALQADNGAICATLWLARHRWLVSRQSES